jgi:hypothetical protein
MLTAGHAAGAAWRRGSAVEFGRGAPCGVSAALIGLARGTTMGLIVPATDAFLGRHVLCEPYYGWGWIRGDDRSVNAYDVAMAGGVFRSRVVTFFDLHGERRGFVGRVEEPGHPFDGLQVVVTAMAVGDYDFEDHPCPRYDVELGPVLPAELGDEMTTGAPRYAGHVFVASSRTALRRRR